MDKNSNIYTFSFAVLMVVLVASLLAVAAISLKPYQETNVELEKQQNILNSVGIKVDRDSANIYYNKYITESFVLNNKGEKTVGNAFTVDLAKEIKKNYDQQIFPVFVSEINDVKSYILPMRGKGLWGPIWGYIALESDANTILGAVFDHKSETPGLGAEINLPWFQQPFVGKKIFNGDQFVSIKVTKGGADKDDLHAVDGISGGTITADGVSDMLYERLNNYLPYLNKQRKQYDIKYESDSLVVDSLTFKAFNFK